jgi:hypothetical protein
MDLDAFLEGWVIASEAIARRREVGVKPSSERK